MNRQPTLASELVELRPLREEDRADLARIAGDEQLWEQHPVKTRWKPEVFTPFFNEALSHEGALVAIDRPSGRLAGSSQYRPTSFDGNAIEIGWTFIAREHWGSGFNAEMKRLMLRHALESVPRVLFRVGASNWRSRKAMEKIGGRLTDLTQEVEHGGQVLRHVVFEITREDFAKGPLS